MNEFDREFRYQTFMIIIKKMLSAGLITEEEFLRIDTIYQQKYKPIFGSLLSRKDLLYAEIRANMSPRKEA